MYLSRSRERMRRQGTWDKPEDKSDDTASKDFNDEIPF